MLLIGVGSNTRIIVRHERDQEQYFAYATALRTASGPAYQIGPSRSRSLIRSKPSSLTGMDLVNVRGGVVSFGRT